MGLVRYMCKNNLFLEVIEQERTGVAIHRAAMDLLTGMAFAGMDGNKQGMLQMELPKSCFSSPLMGKIIQGSMDTIIYNKRSMRALSTLES